MNIKKNLLCFTFIHTQSEKLNAKKKNPCYCVAAALQDEEEELTQVSNTHSHQQ
jgi:hypothetical protein